MQSRGNVPAVSEIKRPGRNEEEFRDECASFRFRFAPMNGDSDGKKSLENRKRRLAPDRSVVDKIDLC